MKQQIACIDWDEIITGINRKEEQAWKILFDAFYVPLCHHSLRIVQDEDAVADVVQDTLLNLWNSKISFNDGKGMIVYLYRAVTNNSLKYLRDRNTENEQLKKWQENQQELSKEYFASIVREEVYRKLRMLVDELPAERRRIVLMSLEGLSGEDIATQLGITIHTVKQQKYRAYQYIRAHMDKYGAYLLMLLFP